MNNPERPLVNGLCMPTRVVVGRDNDHARDGLSLHENGMVELRLGGVFMVAVLDADAWRDLAALATVIADGKPLSTAMPTAPLLTRQVGNA